MLNLLAFWGDPQQSHLIDLEIPNPVWNDTMNCKGIFKKYFFSKNQIQISFRLKFLSKFCTIPI